MHVMLQELKKIVECLFGTSDEGLTCNLDEDKFLEAPEDANVDGRFNATNAEYHAHACSRTIFPSIALDFLSFGNPSYR